MGKIIDYKCTYSNEQGISKEVIEKTGLKFPDAYKDRDSMVTLAKECKDYYKSNLCELPFCHTVEGEALGGKVNLGDENIGPRAKEYICTTTEELLALPKIDFSRGRISETLKACMALREQGENVVLNVSGPFTIMNVLIEPTVVFKTFRKNPELIRQVFDKFQHEIIGFIEEAQKSGVNIISYADSSGGLNILGPKFAEQVVEMFTYPLLKRMDKILDKEMVVVLCPKTTFALLGTEKAVWKDVSIGAPTNYEKGCIKAIGLAKFIGQTCMKNKDFQLKEGIIKAIQLL
ncbi:uroporphyrinogen decarboxylase family protein [Clostridium sp. UBA4548]|uniref:uroporphyrinogen decarboxylase family protein n=1 Tax=Clostridium sp. UBA4548 TaxID=1946361 RepID=UPI0025C30610|nr:uroporphyrinogen decarboxylase family protein [Clostridium sp. UBA4548]